MPFKLSPVFSKEMALCTEWGPVRNSPSDLQQTDMPCLKCKEAFSYGTTGVRVCFSHAVAHLFVTYGGDQP